MANSPITSDGIKSFLDRVHYIRNLLIQVGTAERRIQDAEAEYTELRREVGAGLSKIRIPDPNQFRSLWDWYGYWRSNALNSYQSRRDYINSLYRPVLDAMDSLQGGIEPIGGSSGDPFSVRHGFAPVPVGRPPITIREGAPDEVRRTIIDIAVKTGWGYDDLFHLAARLGKRSWELPQAITSGAPSRIELQRSISSWEWFRVYDFVEAIYSEMCAWHLIGDPQLAFQTTINEYFAHSGVGWRLDDGRLVSRGSEPFEQSFGRATTTLHQSGQSTAERELHEALSDISRRPEPDLTGAIQHAMAALECVARTVCKDPQPTLGKLLAQHSDLIPRPLDSAVEKAWGYASEKGRHIREGQPPSREEAELIVGIAATVATFLTSKLARP